MERNDTRDAANGRTDTDVVELGVASIDTKGPPGHLNDAVGQLIDGAGLSHD
jgi:hypothetical protein